MVAVAVVVVAALVAVMAAASLVAVGGGGGVGGGNDGGGGGGGAFAAAVVAMAVAEVHAPAQLAVMPLAAKVPHQSLSTCHLMATPSYMKRERVAGRVGAMRLARRGV